MEKEIVWTSVALKDFWDIVSYLQQNWSEEVLENFHHQATIKNTTFTKASSHWF